MWPPTSEDLAGCRVVPLGDQATVDVESWTTALTVDAIAPTPAPRPTRTTRPAPPLPRRRPVEPSDPLSAFGDDAALAADPWSGREIGRAAVALFVGVSLAVLSYAEFRGARHGSTRPPSSPPSIVSLAVAEAADLPIAPPSNSARTNVEEAVSLVRGMSMPEARVDTPREAAPARVPVKLPLPPPPAQLEAAPVIEPARVEIRPMATALAGVPERSVSPTPLPAPAPEPRLVAALEIEPGARDEDHIRTTLAQWQAAYSQLDASAAREVWPSVDVRALERAFQSLKSQQLRFDHCDFTVTGARAQAACTGEAVYVPRVGNPSPKTNAREWTFELTRSDQSWKIASARSS